MNQERSLNQALPILAEVLRRFSPYILEQKLLLIVAIVAVVAEVVLRILEPLPLKFVFDYVLGDRQPPYPALEQLEPFWLLTLCAGAILVLTTLRALAAYWSTVSLAIVGSRVMTQVRDRLYCHLQKLSLAYHHKARSGDLIVRVSSDANRLQEILLTATLPLVISSLTLLGTITAMFWIDPNLILLSLVTLPLFAFAAHRLSKRIQKSSLQQRKQEGLVAATAAESIAAIKLIQALSLETAFAQMFSWQNRASLQKSVEIKRLSATLERTVDGVIALGVAIVLWYGSWLVLRDALTAGDVIVFLTYLKNAFKPLQNFAKYTGRLAKAAASGERILNILQQTPDIQDSPQAKIAPTFRTDVTFENISFAYESGHKLLDRVNLTIKSGQLVAISGISGSGKSTLMSLLLRLYDPTSGRILIDGKDIRDYTIASLRAQMSVVLQESLLFAATIKENIAYGIENVTDEEIIAAARLANIDSFINSLPQGYNTILRERGANLSGGQRQRIAIARAAIRRTPILILDEPTTGLDRENEQAVIEALQRLTRHRTTFLITHDLAFAAQADVIVYLEKGKIIEQGNPQDLMNRNGRYAQIYQMQNNNKFQEIIYQ
ncbi:MAG: ABC transporter ATP-binding protein [Xenococcaceae cyanobacterium MO_167.B52]|nr:ABC transporter ATP-binding protein [Xenococcaceae cyanobacterium MO_167.B52]